MTFYMEFTGTQTDLEALGNPKVYEVYDAIRKVTIKVIETDYVTAIGKANWVYINRLTEASSVINYLVETVVNRVYIDSPINVEVSIGIRSIQIYNLVSAAIGEKIKAAFGIETEVKDKYSGGTYLLKVTNPKFKNLGNIYTA